MRCLSCDLTLNGGHYSRVNAMASNPLALTLTPRQHAAKCRYAPNNSFKE